MRSLARWRPFRPLASSAAIEGHGTKATRCPLSATSKGGQLRGRLREAGTEALHTARHRHAPKLATIGTASSRYEAGDACESHLRHPPRPAWTSAGDKRSASALTMSDNALWRS